MDIYESQEEKAQHEQAVEALAEEFHRKVFEIQEIYERTYLALKSQATIKAYLPLFVTRQARAILRERFPG